jgi:eukaryotic-like serine/threonine-protein kinase
MGSPSFMSPEQARGVREVDARSDLWSLGVILYRALTGRRPFVGATAADVLVKICADPIPPPTLVAPDLPPVLDAFFVRALARDPDSRFASAREFAATFSDLVDDLGPAADDAPLDRSSSSLVSLEPSPPYLSQPALVEEGTVTRSGSMGDVAPRAGGQNRRVLAFIAAALAIAVAVVAIVRRWPVNQPVATAPPSSVTPMPASSGAALPASATSGSGSTDGQSALAAPSTKASASPPLVHPARPPIARPAPTSSPSRSPWGF